MRAVRKSQKWWCGSQIGKSGSRIGSWVSASQSVPPYGMTFLPLSLTLSIYSICEPSVAARLTLMPWRSSAILLARVLDDAADPPPLAGLHYVDTPFGVSPNAVN